MASENLEESLENWKLPPFPSSEIYLPNITSRVKTVEEVIPLSDEYTSFTFFSDDLKMTYRDFKYIHLGLVQVGLKPTKVGSNKSAIICLRNKTTILSMVESSLREGPIYFYRVTTKPKYDFSLSDVDLATSLSLDVKINGPNSSEEEKVIIMYRVHYKVMKSENASLSNIGNNFAYESGKTTLYVTKVVHRNLEEARLIHWDRVLLPERWRDENNPTFSEWQRARVDWKEAVEAHVLKVDVPGFSEDEVKIEVKAADRMLQIGGERSKEERREGDKWHCAERSSGKFLRQFKFPENAKLDQWTKGFEKGVLTVTLPKSE